MKRTFLRNHLVVWMAAVVFAYATAIVLVAMAPPNLVLTNFSRAFLPLLIVSILAVLFIWRLTVLLGPADPLAILPGSLAVAFSFGVSYSMDVHSFLPEDGFMDILTFGARPFDFWGQSRIFLCLFVWALFTTWGGFGLKKWSEPARGLPARSIDEIRKVSLWLTFDIVLIICATVAILRAEVVNRVAEGKPENICRAAAQVLQSQTSTGGERVNAVFKLGQVSSEESTNLLRQAARNQPAPVNLIAAANLLGRDDLLGLPLLENSLANSSQLNASYSATSKSPMGISNSVTAIAFQINLGSYLGRVKNPAALPALIRLMNSGNAEIRLGAVQGIRNINSPEIIDPLVKGLDDPDPKVRKSCMWGLGLFLGRDERTYGWHPPHYDSPQDEDQIYLDSFKTWARRRASGNSSP
jgi:hypothetical protein